MLVEFHFFDEGSLQLLLDFKLKFFIHFFFVFNMKSHNHFTRSEEKKSYFVSKSCNSEGKKGREKTCKNFLNCCSLYYLLLKWSWNKKFDTFFINKLFAPHLTRHSERSVDDGVRKYFSHLSGFALNKRRRQRQWRVRLMGFM